ncbi:pentapeptide repeat-containing protein [Gemmatimonas groenlandica]|uniref:Pentapeptide repeat-containing protein n=1 Tax=Gemmatimonas groenlandica TaxID=2732249 RepID=A0A6M4IPA3_9BACT|nr:pentapeptide repeat-containing protein [Gemmatimonas groenlandica]
MSATPTGVVLSTGAELTGAELTGAELTGAELTGAGTVDTSVDRPAQPASAAHATAHATTIRHPPAIRLPHGQDRLPASGVMRVRCS